MLEKIKNFLLYFGNERGALETAMPKIRESNRITVACISCFATILILAMYISTYFVEGIQANRTVYLIGIGMSIVVFISALCLAKDCAWMVRMLICAAYFIFYTYGILIGTVTDPGEKTVTFMVMLVFLPVLFIDRPIYSIFTTSIYMVVFIYLCNKTKTGAVLQNDTIDAIVFGLLGLISGMMINRGKVHGYILENELKDASCFDRLTRMHNRNAYEDCLEDISSYANDNLACVYIDVNGLREINNSKGHARGDEMLKTIAEEIQNYFGEEFSFRVGGDEFIIFIPDANQFDIEYGLYKLIKGVEAKGYHVASGFEIATIKELSVDKLISAAEKKMYNNKKQFYKDAKNNRRAE